MNMIANPVRETDLEAGGVVRGVAIGLVTQNKDPDNLCRVKVSFPWHDKPRDSYWARLVAPMAGKGRGVVFIPEVGDEVLVGFERDDLRFPVVLGGLWNGKDGPPRANRDGNNDERIIHSRGDHYLLFNDNARGVVELFHSKGRKVRFDDDGILIEDGKGSSVKLDAGSGDVTIKAVGELKISARTVTIRSSSTTAVNATGTLTLGGSMVNIN